MFEFIRRKRREKEQREQSAPEAVADTTSSSADGAATDNNDDDASAQEALATQQPEQTQEKPAGLFGRLRQGLSRTRGNLADGLTSLIAGRKTIDPDLLEDIETQLLTADFGLEATDHVIEALKARVKRHQLQDPDALMEALKDELRDLLAPCSAPLRIDEDARPWVMLVVGVNGVGKTTTIGKLARRLQEQGKSVMLAAGDTFRAAAVEQLQVWGERNDVPVIAQATGSDSASVIFDAYQAAKARGIDVLIADTAGRLHNKSNLMQELEKIVRVLRKQNPELPHEAMLVLDATTGQNALSQAKSFHEAVQLTGITLTKLDGTAKGGMVFAIAREMQLPIRFIGVGESLEDLQPFRAGDFVDALFSERS